MDALKKADETKKPEITTSHHDNSPPIDNEEEELSVVEITNDEMPETTSYALDHSSEPSVLNWDKDLLAEFKEDEPTTLHDSEQSSDSLSLNEDILSEPKNLDIKEEAVSPAWEDELLPEFRDDIDESKLEVSSDEHNDEQLEPKNVEAFSDDGDKKLDDFKNGRGELGITAVNPNKSFEFNYFTDSKVKPRIDEDVAEVDKDGLPLEENGVEKYIHQPEDAKRILAASEHSNSSKRTLWLAGLLGVLVVGMGGGYYYYVPYLSTPPQLFIRPPRQPPIFQPSTSAPVEVTTSQKELVPTPARGNQRLIPTPARGNQKKNPSPIEPPIRKQIQPVAKTGATSKQSTNAANIHATAPTKKPFIPKKLQVKPRLPRRSTVPNPQKPQVKQEPPAKQVQEPLSPPTAPGIYTLRKTVAPKINTGLSEGYAALQRGNNKVALRAYTKVLQQEPNNRDALLGLAALAWQSGKRQKAQQYYRQILRLNPQDTYAQLGLINTLSRHSPKSESQLKLLLEQAPQSAHIHFSLGNFYASRGRWVQAQQAYFDALRYDKNQADYAYNLAISLEHLNKPRLALSYYQRALQLARNKRVNFNIQAARKRVQTLASHSQESALANLPLSGNR